jgi:hypothetical protein
MDIGQLMTMYGGNANILSATGNMNQYSLINAINAAAIATANGGSLSSQTNSLGYPNAMDASSMMWPAMSNNSSAMPNNMNNNDLFAAQAVAQSMFMAASMANGMNMQMLSTFPMNPLLMSSSGFSLPASSTMSSMRMMRDSMMVNNVQGMPFQLTDNSNSNVMSAFTSRPDHGHTNMNGPNPTPLPLPFASPNSSTQPQRIHPFATHSNEDDFDAERSLKKRKKLNAPPEWAESVGQLRHSENQVQSGMNLAGVKRKYKMLKCKICAIHVPSSPWGTMRPRKFESSVFEEHERSAYHRKAIEMQIAACSGSSTGGILG